MTVDEVMAKLEGLGDGKMRAWNLKNGAGDNQFGVKMGDLRTLAKTIKTNHELGLQLWQTGNVEAMLLATLLIKPKQLTVEELETMIRSFNYVQLAEWFISYVVKMHPEKEMLREKWMQGEHPMAARAGWSLTTERLEKNPDGLDVKGLLDRIENEMATAHELPQWTMNFALLAIGINFPEHRERALEIGEKLGVYRDYPCSKGCTSPFAPIAIAEMVRRKEAG